MQNRRQHYIPQFYLNKFVDPLVLPPMTPYVWVFEKNAYESIKKAPINTAYGLGFYDFHYKDGTMSTNFDDNLKILESKAAVISKKIEKGFIINNNDKMVFAEFIWTMQMRTPYQRNNINNTLTEIERYMLKVTANHPDELRKMISGRNNNVEIADAEIEKLIDIIKSDNFDVIIPPEYSISNIIELAEEFTKLFLI